MLWNGTALRSTIERFFILKKILFREWFLKFICRNIYFPRVEGNKYIEDVVKQLLYVISYWLNYWIRETHAHVEEDKRLINKAQVSYLPTKHGIQKNIYNHFKFIYSNILLFVGRNIFLVSHASWLNRCSAGIPYGSFLIQCVR